MRRAFIFLLFVILGGEVFAQGPCPSRPARPEDQSHGANEFIEQKKIEFSKKMRGRVTDRTGSPLPGGTVIIVFQYSPREEGEETTRLIKRLKRFRAFLPEPDGSYCIAGLPPGRYLLQVGTVKQLDFNEMFLRIRIRKSSPRKRVRAVIRHNVELPVGT